MSDQTQAAIAVAVVAARMRDEESRSYDYIQGALGLPSKVQALEAVQSGRAYLAARQRHEARRLSSNSVCE